MKKGGKKRKKGIAKHPHKKGEVKSPQELPIFGERGRKRCSSSNGKGGIGHVPAVRSRMTKKKKKKSTTALWD